MSLFIFVTSWICSIFIVTKILFNYKNPKTSHPTILLAVFLCWLFPFSLTFLLPMDITSSRYDLCLESGAENCAASIFYVSASVRHVTWLIVYWISFFLSWILVPILQGFVVAGQFDFAGKLRYSIKINIYFYLAAISILSVLVFYFRYGTQANTWTATMALLMALSNAVGLLAVVIFLGHGLVRLPRHFWHSANASRQLRKAEAKALEMKEKYQDAEDNLNNIISEIQELQNHVRDKLELQQYADLVLAAAPIPSGEVLPTMNFPQNGLIISDEDCMDEDLMLGFGEGQYDRNRFKRIHPHARLTIDLNFIEGLNYRLKDALSTRDRTGWEWQNLCKRAWYYQDVINNKSFSIDRQWSSTVEEFGHSRARSRIRWWWNVHFRLHTYRFLALIVAVLSLIIFWSEVTLVFGGHFSLISTIVNNGSLSPFMVELITLGILLYVAFCSYSSFLKLNVFSYFQLVPGHHTDEKSLLFFSAYFTRFTLPLGYNYLTLLEGGAGREGLPGSDRILITEFSKVMGTMDLVPLLGRYFNLYVPLLFLLVCSLVLFRLYNRAFQTFLGFGISQQLPDSPSLNLMDQEADIIDGRELIGQARRHEEELVRSRRAGGRLAQEFGINNPWEFGIPHGKSSHTSRSISSTLRGQGINARNVNKRLV